MTQEELKKRIDEFMEQEGKSCSIDIAGIMPEYIYRMCGGKVPMEEIAAAMEEIMI